MSGARPRTRPRAASTLFVLLGTLAASAQVTKPPRPEANALTSEYWKSQTTGNEYRVRIQGDTFYAEWVNIPHDLALHGGYVRTECRRVGSKWIGTTRSRSLLPCTESAEGKGKAEGKGQSSQVHVETWCSLVTRTEIDSLAPDRITGRGQAPHQLDCQTCKLLETRWKDFTWVPKR